MKGLIASGILLSLAVLAIGFAGGFAPLWDNTYPWQCTRLCDDDFWQAATLEDVRAELEDGKDVNGVRESSDWNTPLHLAVRRSVAPEIVELLLAAGADPNASGYRDVDDHPYNRELAPRTPLQTATEYGEHTPEVIGLLLEYGADPNPSINPDNSRSGPLAPLTYSLRGAERHRAAIVELLLKHGANTEVRGWWHYEEGGATALHLAAAVADPALLEVFLRYGADFHVRSDLDGYYAGYADGTVLHAAAKMNPHPESIEFLIEQGIDVNAVTRNGETPLHLAGKNANSEVMRVLLEHGADPNARTSSGSTPLLWAIWGDPCQDMLHCQQVVALLLGSGSDPNARNDWDDTALHESILEKRDAKVIETLLNHGADGTAKYHQWVGENSHLSAPLAPLHLAAYVGSPTEVIEVLIDRGADVKARDENGLTPLHLAAGNNDNSHIVQYLLSRAADSNAKDANGETPLHLAAKGDLCRRHEAHCRFLVSHLLYNSADTNALNNEGVPPLHIVISRALDHTLVRMLLEFGADPALMNSEGATALHMAVALYYREPRYYRDESARALDIVNELLDSGMDVNIRSGPATGLQDEGLGLATPLHWAVFHARFDVEFLKLLVRQGADLQATNQLGETPCQLTTRLGRVLYNYQHVCT